MEKRNQFQLIIITLIAKNLKKIRLNNFPQRKDPSTVYLGKRRIEKFKKLENKESELTVKGKERHLNDLNTYLNFFIHSYLFIDDI